MSVLKRLHLTILVASVSWASPSGTLTTNALVVHHPPSWLSPSLLESATQPIQLFLEWDIRKVPVYFYVSQSDFLKAQNLGDTVLATTDRKSGTIHVGPRVNKENFSRVFGHELAHVIVLQKYRKAIPPWLEEGLANYAAKNDKVDYTFLKSAVLPPVRDLVHPFGQGKNPRLVYEGSTALMHFLQSRCAIRDLLQLSVGKTLESYLGTFCQISDLDVEFRAWLAKQKPTQ